jgi:isopentenyl diphosphate isomerase/L-lactate dehydrogenase-like FMN-dependent dehydrogenase
MHAFFAGVEHAMGILQDELTISLQLCGCRSPEDVQPSHVWRSDGAAL